MRDLLVQIDPTVWSEISVVLFGLGFVALIFWVCLPVRKSTYERAARLPLDSE